MKIVAVIPAYNEESTIGDVLDRVHPYVDEIVVVDDGSEDRTAPIAHSRDAAVVQHEINRGLGASLGTGFAVAQRLHADVVVTLDADGQHDPSEIPKFLDAIQKGADMVIGSRMLTGCVGMPIRRLLAQVVGNLVTWLLFGAWVTDSQSGFRAFTRFALAKIHVRTNRMEVSSELIAEAKRHRLTMAQVPIQPIYTSYSLSKGQSFAVGLKTLFRLVIRRFTR